MVNYSFNIKAEVDDKNIFIKNVFERLNYDSYLEIGLEHDTQAPYRILQAKVKHSVDIDASTNADFIMTSNVFFEKLKNNEIEKIQKGHKWDVIFIDADHNCEQVYEDLKNSLNFLNDDGLIFIHDVMPKEYLRTLELAIFVEQNQFTLPLMNNDAWKVMHYVLKEEPNLHACTLFENQAGLGVIKKSKDKRNLLNKSINKFYKFSEIINNPKKLMNNITPDNIFEWIKQPYYNF